MASKPVRKYEGEPYSFWKLVKFPNGHSGDKQVFTRPPPPSAACADYPRQTRLNQNVAQILVQDEIRRLLDLEDMDVSEIDSMEMSVMIGKEEKPMGRGRSMSLYNHDLGQADSSLKIWKRSEETTALTKSQTSDNESGNTKE